MTDYEVRNAVVDTSEALSFGLEQLVKTIRDIVDQQQETNRILRVLLEKLDDDSEPE